MTCLTKLGSIASGKRYSLVICRQRAFVQGQFGDDRVWVQVQVRRASG